METRGLPIGCAILSPIISGCFGYQSRPVVGVLRREAPSDERKPSGIAPASRRSGFELPIDRSFRDIVRTYRPFLTRYSSRRADSPSRAPPCLASNSLGYLITSWSRSERGAAGYPGNSLVIGNCAGTITFR